MPRSRVARPIRVAGLAAALGASLVLTGCGFNVQTLQPYTPADGTNADVSGGPVIRNILIVANDDGKGVLSASLVSQTKPDSLIGIMGTASSADGAADGPLVISSAGAEASPAASPSASPSASPAPSASFDKVDLPAGQMVILADPSGTPKPKVQVSGSTLKPGLDASLTLTFSSGAVQTITVPVMDAKNPTYAAIGKTIS